MEAAMECFQGQGYKNCTIEEIAERAGVFKGSFYNHFESKEALAVEVIKEYIANVLGHLPLEGPPSSPIARLREHFALLAKIRKKGEEGCLMAGFSAEIGDETPLLRAALIDVFDQWARALAEVIRQAQGCGEVSKQSKADFLARTVGNSWEGAAIRAKVMKSQKPLNEVISVIFDVILQAKP